MTIWFIWVYNKNNCCFIISLFELIIQGHWNYYRYGWSLKLCIQPYNVHFESMHWKTCNCSKLMYHATSGGSLSCAHITATNVRRHEAKNLLNSHSNGALKGLTLATDTWQKSRDFYSMLTHEGPQEMAIEICRDVMLMEFRKWRMWHWYSF